MANNSTLEALFAQTREILNQQYHWISDQDQPEDYFDLAVGAHVTPQDLIQGMLEDGVIELTQQAVE